MSIAEELDKLGKLHQSGALTDAEFTRAKQKLLGTTDDPPPPPPPPQPAPWISVPAPGPAPDQLERQTRSWAMGLHLSLLAGHVVPWAGLVVPIVIWQVKKDELPGLDAHGKAATNWIISVFIYSAIFGVLSIIAIGIPFLIALALIGLVFPIVGAIKASNGEVWKYPLSFQFLK